MLGAPLSGSVGSLGFNRLEFLGIYEKCPKLSRNWCETLAVLARSNGRSLRTVEVVGLLDYPRYLVPTVPLAKDLQSIRGSLLPFADHLRVLSLPCLLPSKYLYNLAIFGVACRSLELLQFVELSSYSASSIPILRFFPTVQALAVKLIVGLPFAPHLRQGQLDRFTAQGRGDVVAALGDLFSLDSQLDTILFENGKYFYREHCEMFGRVLIEKGRGNLTFPTLIPLAPEEVIQQNSCEGRSTCLLSRSPTLTHPCCGCLIGCRSDGARDRATNHDRARANRESDRAGEGSSGAATERARGASDSLQ